MQFSKAETKLEEALRACRQHFVSAALFSAFLNLLFIAPMLYMLQVYDRVVPTQGGLTLLFLTLALLVALGTLALLDFVRSRLLVRASVRLDQQLTHAILEQTIAEPGGTAPKLTRHALREFDTLRQTLTGPGIIALFDAPWTPIYILVCFIIHPLIGVLGLVGSILLLLTAWRNERATREPLQRANEAAGAAYASQDQSAASADVVRSLGMRQAIVSRHLQEREEMMALQTKASFGGSGYVAVSKFLRLALQSLALGGGALLAINNQISAGAIFASMFMVGRALAPIDQLLGAWKGIVQARGAYETLVDLFGVRAAGLAPTQLPDPVGRLSIEHLSVTDAARETPILHHISFQVEPGEAIGIVGPSGAGKSTLLRMIANAATAEAGSIRFDGAQQCDWDPERLAEHIGYLPQEPTLFSGTIKDNVSRFRSWIAEDREAVDAATVEAARLVGAHELILRLPGGYDYQLGLGGRGLSAGQAQRIALARALFGSPRYLVLDEPNSHLDSQGDLQLISTLSEMKKRGATILLVAHKLNILPVIDRLVVLQNGRVAMIGPRDEVMSKIAAPRGPRPVPQPQPTAVPVSQ
jgi:PrtD family type I secretion system ABC transporter